MTKVFLKLLDLKIAQNDHNFTFYPKCADFGTYNVHVVKDLFNQVVIKAFEINLCNNQIMTIIIYYPCWNLRPYLDSSEHCLLSTNIVGNSTILSILSLHMKFLKENLFSCIITVWGSRHIDICFVASLCCLHLGQYLKQKWNNDMSLKHFDPSFNYPKQL